MVRGAIWILLGIAVGIVVTLATYAIAAGDPTGCGDVPHLSVDRLGLVILHAEPQVAGAEILLGDIACIVGEAEWTQRLAEVSVGAAPLVGGVRELDVATLKLRLRQAGIPDRDVEFVSPAPRIAVRRAAQVLDGAMFVAAVADAVASQYPENAHVQVNTSDTEEVAAPMGDVDLRVRRIPSLAAGFASVPVEVYVDGELWRTVSVRAEVQVTHPVWVASRRIDRGEPIGPHNAHQEYVAIPAGRQPAVITAESPVRATRAIRAGSMIDERHVEPVPDALAGDRIGLWADLGGVKVQTTGILLADARLGELVPVRNEASGRTVYGRLVDLDKVAVPIAAP